MNSLIEFLSTYELPHNNENECPVFQRIKILTARSQGTIKFSIVGTNKYLIHTTNNATPNNSVSDIFPVRSAVIHVDNGVVKVKDYSINRVTQITNKEFLEKYQSVNEQPEYVCHEAYEGPIIIANKENDTWYLRTTSCIDAFTSRFCSVYSHGEQFNMTCQHRGFVDYTDALDRLAAQINDAYFVFLMVTPETRHLCSYEFAADLFLLHARSMEDNTPQDISVQTYFHTPQRKSYEEVLHSLSTNLYFSSAFLAIQGYVMIYPNGDIYKTHTPAYDRGLQIIPYHDNIIFNAVHAYLGNNIQAYFTLCGIDNVMGSAIVVEINVITKTIANIVAYMFTKFTTLDTTGQHKVFHKINGELYARLNENSLSHHFIIALAHVQSRCCGQNHFNDMGQLARDVGNCLRTLDQKTYNAMVRSYTRYKDFLNGLMDRPFSNSYDEQFQSIIERYFG